MAGATFGTTMLGIGAVVVVAVIGLVISFAVAAVLAVIGVICFVPLVIEKTAVPATRGHC